MVYALPATLFLCRSAYQVIVRYINMYRIATTYVERNGTLVFKHHGTRYVSCVSSAIKIRRYNCEISIQ